MKLISLRDLLSILSNPAHVFSIDGCSVVLHLNAITYRDDNLFLLAVWHDVDAREFVVAFPEGVNRQVKVGAECLCLIDADDNLLELTYAPKPQPAVTSAQSS